jgi:fructokinase
MQVCSIGEVLWDQFADGEQFGGAALNFCANLHRLGDQALLLSGVGKDVRGKLALERMVTLGLSTDGVAQVDDLATGTARVETTPAGEPHFTIPRPAAFDGVQPSPAIARQIEQGVTDWLYFGTLMQTAPKVEAITRQLAGLSPHLRCFYDMNLRENQWNLPLVERLSQLATVLKLNESEAETLHAATTPPSTRYAVETFCRTWAERFAIEVICVTLGAEGCLVLDQGTVHRVPGFSIRVADTVGAGDAFGAAFLHGYHRGWPVEEAARFANALGAIVASRAGATPEWTREECERLMHSA